MMALMNVASQKRNMKIQKHLNHLVLDCMPSKEEYLKITPRHAEMRVLTMRLQQQTDIVYTIIFLWSQSYDRVVK